ncbi:Hypothetical protein CINCED_3A001003 [Cinara cedri]|uniref:Uncharacterized protein n=1 Tax=Cinara cedri TaxID=506608 RepID=A0A5E4NCT6_9HEMI|nr:Hypothetical protein CINCED_3A001003 [Cinara cedri]
MTDSKYESKNCKESTGTICAPMENNIIKSPLDKPVFDTKNKHKGLRSDDIIECDIVKNSERVDKYPRAVELYLNDSILFMLNWHKQLLILKNTVAETMAGIVLMSITWWLIYLFIKLLPNYSTDYSKYTIILAAIDYIYFIILYVISTAVGRVIKLTNYLPPLMGIILASCLYSICLNDIYNKSANKRWPEFTYFVFIICEVTTFTIMTSGVFEIQYLELQRIRGALTRLILLPLTVESLILLWALKSDNFNIDIIIIDHLPYGGHVTLLPNLFRLQRKVLSEENDTISLLIAALNLMEVVTCIMDGLLIYLAQIESNKKNFYGINDVKFEIFFVFIKDVMIEIIFGILYGFLMIFVPNTIWKNTYIRREKELNENHEAKNRQISVIRFILFLIEGFLIGLYKCSSDFPITWSLGCAVTALVACFGWKRRSRREIIKNESISNSVNHDIIYDQISSLTKVFEYIFTLLIPIIFGLFGWYYGYLFMHFVLADHFTGRILSVTLRNLFIAFSIRIIATTCSVLGAGFNVKEIVFINIAWLINSNMMLYFAIAMCFEMQTPANEVTQLYNLLYETMIGTVISMFVKVILGTYVIPWLGVKLLKKSNGGNLERK